MTSLASGDNQLAFYSHSDVSISALVHSVAALGFRRLRNNRRAAPTVAEPR